MKKSKKHTKVLQMQSNLKAYKRLQKASQKLQKRNQRW